MKRTLYFNGEILTMGNPLYAEAVLVQDGVITHVGTRDALLKLIDRQTTICNLNGSVLLPGFVDSHSHFFAYAQTLSTAPLGGCRSMEEIAKVMVDFAADIPQDEWVVGFGYDPSLLKEKVHPDCRLLDGCLPHRKVLITHASGHMGVFSSDGLAALGVTSSTPDMAGGEIGRFSQSGEPDGFMAEQAFMTYAAQIPPPPEDAILRQLDKAQRVYAQYGITTVQEGRTNLEAWNTLRRFSDSGNLHLDVVCYVDSKTSKHIAQENLSRIQNYKRHLKINGYKLFLDGSPQGKTAWLTQPYLTGEDADYCGIPIYTDEEAELLIYEALNDHVQLLVHCNGDAAAEQLISCVERITEGKDLELRPVMIHAQLVRPDQLPRMARLGMIASFFVAHTFYWGDVHVKNLGLPRASLISPCQSAKQAGVIFTLHQDTPVILPNMLHTVWCAVNRQTRSGAVLGEQEQISTLDALRAITVNSAYQCFEEDKKGVIAAGMAADFVILDYNPMRVRPADIKRIRVMKTIKDDNVIYERKS